MRKKWMTSVVIAFAVVALPVAGLAQTERTGHQQIDRLISRAESTISQISLTRLQAQDTIDAYEALIAEGSDSRRAFRDLESELGKLDNRRARTRRAADRMRTSADDLFGDWQSSISRISGEELSAKATARLEDTRQRYDELIALGGEAGDAFEAFADSLRDQLVFVEHDLNAEALQSLRDYSPAFEEKSKALFRKINSVVGTASRLIDSMRSP